MHGGDANAGGNDATPGHRADQQLCHLNGEAMP